MSSKKELLDELLADDMVLLEPREFLDNAIIGTTHDNRVVYDYDLLVKSFMDGEKWTEEESIEWIDYNTIRSLPYVSNAPVILYSLEKYE